MPKCKVLVPLAVVPFVAVGFVSVCAFIDAYFNSSSDESTKIIQEDDPTLRELLEAVYPNDHPVVKAALKCMHRVQNGEEDE